MEPQVYLQQVLDQVIGSNGQDLFLKAGAAPRMRVGDRVIPLDLPAISHGDLEALLEAILTPVQAESLRAARGVDFGFSHPQQGYRFRGNAFYQQGGLSVVFRLLWRGVPSVEDLRLPPIIKKVALEKSGIVLVAGTVSSGKTTTVAAMVRAMNETLPKHVITVEDPIEYVHGDGLCLVQQREIGLDAPSFTAALKQVVRQSPDVVVIGEMRDAESFSFALSAAEVGRLVLATVHAPTVLQVFDRVLGFFAPEHREAVLRHFAWNVTCIAAQKLLVAKDGKSLIPSVEVMLGNYTIRQIILEKKLEKLEQALRNGRMEGMQTMDQSLMDLWDAGGISRETALAHCRSTQEFEAAMKGFKIRGDTKILNG